MADPPAVVPRKRPRQARAAATVEAIIEASARILEAEGLAGFNTNAVAALAGVSIGSLYQYFPGKEAILAALARREAEAFDAALGVALGEIGDLGTPSAVARLAQVAVDHQTRHTRLARILDLEEQRLGLTEAQAAAGRTVQAIAAGHPAPVARPDRRRRRAWNDRRPGAAPLLGDPRLSGPFPSGLVIRGQVDYSIPWRDRTLCPSGIVNLSPN